MIIGHINKLDKKNINKNFIKKRHGLEKKLDCSSFIYSTKNTMFMIFDKKFNEYNFYEDHKFILYIKGSLVKHHFKLKAEQILLEFRLNRDFPVQKFTGSYFIFIFDKYKNEIICITDYFNSHKIYVKKNKSETLFSSNLGLPIILNLIEKKISKQFFYRYTLGNYRSSHGRIISPLEELNLLPGRSLIKLSYKLDIEIKTLKYSSINKNLKKYNYLTIKNSLNKYFKNFYSYFLGKEKNTCILLSGGFDSMLLIYYWQKFIKKKIQAYTIYFDNIDLKDTRYSKILSKQKNLRQTMIEFSPKKFLNELKNIYKKYDYPIATVSQLAFINLYNSINKKYKFILTGYGGDYLFGGSYNSFLYNLSDLRRESKKKFNLELKEWMKLHSTEEYFKDKFTFQKFEKINCDKKKGVIKDPFIEAVNYKKLLKNKINIEKIKSEIEPEKEFLQTYTKWAYKYESVAPVSDTEVTLDFNKNLKTFTPFIDKNLQDLSLKTPSNLKIKKGINRIFLRNLLKNKVSEKLLMETNKFGFNCPFDEWIRDNSEIYSFIIKKLFNKRSVCMKIYGKNFLETILKSHKKKESNYSHVIWQLLNFELWYEEWIKK